MVARKIIFILSLLFLQAQAGLNNLNLSEKIKIGGSGVLFLYSFYKLGKLVHNMTTESSSVTFFPNNWNGPGTATMVKNPVVPMYKDPLWRRQTFLWGGAFFGSYLFFGYLLGKHGILK